MISAQPKFARLGSRSGGDGKKQQIYALVLERLLTARYRFGEPISVKSLIDETGISKQPIMTALVELRVEGFVEISPQVGCQVVRPKPERVSDFYRMFGRLEGLMAELAAERRESGDTDSLREINDRIRRLESKGGPVANYRRLNREFHSAMHEIARSESLHEVQLKNFALSDFWIAQCNGFSTVLHHAVHEHDRIIEAIETGRPFDARSAAEQHIGVVAVDVLNILMGELS